MLWKKWSLNVPSLVSFCIPCPVETYTSQHTNYRIGDNGIDGENVFSDKGQFNHNEIQTSSSGDLGAKCGPNPSPKAGKEAVDGAWWRAWFFCSIRCSSVRTLFPQNEVAFPLPWFLYDLHGYRQAVWMRSANMSLVFGFDCDFGATLIKEWCSAYRKRNQKYLATCNGEDFLPSSSRCFEYSTFALPVLFNSAEARYGASKNGARCCLSSK